MFIIITIAALISFNISPIFTISFIFEHGFNFLRNPRAGLEGLAFLLQFLADVDPIN